MIAIGAFAGFREAEIQRLDWSEVDSSARAYRSQSGQGKERAKAHRADTAESHGMA
jgi:hypothetical protein